MNYTNELINVMNESMNGRSTYNCEIHVDCVYNVSHSCICSTSPDLTIKVSQPTKPKSFASSETLEF